MGCSHKRGGGGGGEAQYLTWGWWSKAGTEQRFALPRILLHVPMGGPVATGLTCTALERDHAPEPASSATVTLFFPGGSGASYPRDQPFQISACCLGPAPSCSFLFKKIVSHFATGTCSQFLPCLQMATCGERPHNFHWCSLLPSSLTRTLPSWGSGVWTLRRNGCLQHPQGQPLWVAFCWAVSHGRAWAWEPIGGIPATHLVP